MNIKSLDKEYNNIITNIDKEYNNFKHSKSHYSIITDNTNKTKQKVMAKEKSAGVSIKINFGKRKKGKAQKSFNKHDRSEKNYRGQGR